MIRKTLLITGVSIDGIGYQVCKHILHVQRVAREPASWRIILAQRDPSDLRARAAREQLEKSSAAVHASVVSYTCDLADFSSIRRCVAAIKEREDVIDVAVLNAGAVVNQHVTTVNECEASYQVNHIGHFLMLSLLQDVIRERVVFVGSSLHKKANAQDTLASLDSYKQRAVGTSGMKQYGQAKLLSAYCLSHWHDIFSKRNVSVVMVSPGFVPSTALSRDNTWIARFAMNWVIHYLPIARTPQQAGMTVSALVCGDEWKTLDNCYVNADLKQERMHEDVYDADHADRVWQWSRQVCSITQ